MNIQIYGSKKSFDTKKAERYFKERKIKYVEYVPEVTQELSYDKLLAALEFLE